MLAPGRDMTAHQVGVMLLGLAAIIVLARLLGAAAKRVGQPPVVGEILSGFSSVRPCLAAR
jgi:Kef-type K+ transport system membrane component KefB